MVGFLLPASLLCMFRLFMKDEHILNCETFGIVENLFHAWVFLLFFYNECVLYGSSIIVLWVHFIIVYVAAEG